MAFIRCEAGGKASATIVPLWTNQSPASSQASQVATLSESIANYEYILVRYKTLADSTGVTAEVAMKVSDFINKTGSTDKYTRIALARYNVSAITVRYLWYLTDTTVQISNASAGSTQSNVSDIVTEICGIIYN